MEYYHPKKRNIRKIEDAYLKLLDILYFYYIGESDEGKIKKQINLLKLIVKRKFPEEYEKFDKFVEDVKKEIENSGKNAYEKLLKSLKRKRSKLIKRLETEKKGSLLAYLKS